MLDQLIEETRKEFPDFKTVRKRDSRLMKTINVFLMIISFGLMRSFFRFYTTLGTTIYVPDSWDTSSEISRAATIRHERVHMRQARKYTRFVFSFLYLFVFFPAGLAYFRMRFEKEAYEESIRAMYEYAGPEAIQDEVYRDKIITHFTSAEYYWMWPFRKSLEAWYDGVVKKVLNGVA